MKLLTIDGNSIINRAYYGIRQLSTKDGIYTNGILGFLNILMKVQEETSPDAVAIAFDMKGPTFRHEKFEDYKAGRKGMPEELAQQMPLLQELLGYLGYAVVQKQSYEADDILGTLSETCKKKGWECVIATGDRDAFQLIGDGVSVRLASTQRGQPSSEFYDTDAIMAKYGVKPSQLIDVKALMGDPSDNIPGVKGIGEKTALKLIQDYGSIDYIYDHLEEIELKPAQRKNITEEKKSAYLSRELGEIDCCVPIDTDLVRYKKQPVENALAYPLMARLELFSQMGKLGVRPPSEVEVIDPASDSSPNLEIEFGEIPNALLDSNKPLDVLFGIVNGEFENICVSGENVIYFQDTDAKAMAKKILTSHIPKRTNGLKQLWHLAITEGFEIKNVTLDAEIGAYILNPTATDYNLERLKGEQAIYTAPLEENQKAMFPILQQAAGFTALCNNIERQITENKQEHLLTDMELPLARVLADMELAGVLVDKDGLEKFGEKLDITLIETEKRIYFFAGEEFNINSPKQLGEILFVKLGLPPQKKTKTGYSTNVDVLEFLKDKHPIIEDILEYRQVAKLKSTYVDGLIAVIRPDGRVHTTFQQTLTRTGRISSTDPNIQNIPIRTALGSELRRFFVSKPGNLFFDADYSQIELRVLAHLADDKHMIAAFANNEDIHTQTAAQVFDMPPQLVTPLMRNRAKAVNFGIVYGIGAFSLSGDIGVSVHEAGDYIKNYLSFYSGVNDYMENVVAQGTKTGYVTTMFGRRRYLPELSSSNHIVRKSAERIALNTPVQGSAADIIKVAMIRVYARLNKENMRSRLLLQIHDELILEGPPDEQEMASKILQEEMENAAQLKVPLVAEVKVGENWLEV